MPKPTQKLDPDWAWDRYEPERRRPWNLALAGHLFRRAAFGASWDELDKAVEAGPQRTVDRLLDPGDDADAFGREYDEYEAAASGAIEGLRAWWLRRMIHTPHPLLEKMTLFWHGHFGVSVQRVSNNPLMHRHVQLLRSGALGDFEALLAKVVGDPATLLSLGAAANRKALPNEDFARRFLGEFAVGQGNYTEEDVRGIARSFTGHFVIRYQFRYLDREHDAGSKTVLEKTGQFGGEDAVRVVARHPATAEHVVRGLYRWLICETEEPTRELLTPLIESFTADRDVGRLVETMLRSNLFFSETAYRRRIKSPVEFAVGIAHSLEASPPTLPLGRHLAAMGQDLYAPPTVKGWPGGTHWINPATLIARSNLATAMTAPGGPYGGKLDPAAVATKRGHRTNEAAAEFLIDLFLQGDVTDAQRRALLSSMKTGPGRPQKLRSLTGALTSLPEFQLA